MNEVWRQIPNRLYKVSNLRRVRNSTTGQILKPRSTNGYTRVGLYDGKYPIDNYIHKLVLRTFIGKPPAEWYETHHIDGNKSNNLLTNLKYVTHSENHRLHRLSNDFRYYRKLNIREVKEVKQLLNIGNLTHRLIAKIYKVEKHIISDISRGRSWSYVH